MNDVPETNVIAIFRQAMDTYMERSSVYGADGHEQHGKLLKVLFPKGITLETEEEFTRFILFIFKTAKVCRYSRNIKKGGHRDSVHDVGVYSFILEDFDERANNRK